MIHFLSMCSQNFQKALIRLKQKTFNLAYKKGESFASSRFVYTGSKKFEINIISKNKE